MGKRTWELIKQGINSDTGRSYRIVRITKPESFRPPSDIGKYKVHLYGYGDQWGNMEDVDTNTGIRQLVGAAYFDELDDAKVYAYNFMALRFGI